MSLSLDGNIVGGFAKGGSAFIDKSKVHESLIGQRVSGITHASSTLFSDTDSSYNEDDFSEGGTSGYANYPNDHGPTFVDTGTIIGVFKDVQGDNDIYVAVQDDNGNVLKHEIGSATANPNWHTDWFKLSDLSKIGG